MGEKSGTIIRLLGAKAMVSHTGVMVLNRVEWVVGLQIRVHICFRSRTGDGVDHPRVMHYKIEGENNGC